MNKLKTIIFPALALLVMSSCHIYNYVTVNKDPEADFSKYKTFAWLDDIADTMNLPYQGAIVRGNIKNYFGKELSRKGFVFEPEHPDILLQLVVHNVPKVREVIVLPQHSKYYIQSDFYFPYRNDYYYSRRKIYCYPQGYCAEQIEYIEGSITLNVIDRKKNTQVWSATALGDIYDPSLINESIHPSVKLIMKKYPLKEVNK